MVTMLEGVTQAHRAEGEFVSPEWPSGLASSKQLMGECQGW
jgi:hypothetical protein